MQCLGRISASCNCKDYTMACIQNQASGDHMHVIITGACPQLHNIMAAHLAQSLATPFDRFHWLTSCPAVYRSNDQVAKKSAVINLFFKGSQSICSCRQGKQITQCHNSRTKLCMKLLNVEKQDNIEFYLSCKFQRSTFNVRCKTDVTDGKIAPQVLMPRGNIS